MDDQTIDRIEREVSHVTLADHLLAWDKKQATHVTEIVRGGGLTPDRHVLTVNPDARRCQKDPAHGLLQIHASGAQLMCCVTRPTVCDYAEPVSR
jgi:hypothetical protein